MVSSFKSLKAKSGQKFLDEVTEQLDNAVAKNNGANDERFWTPTVDKAGNGYAVIRFLPTAETGPHFVQYYQHVFQGPGGWYIEKSLTTLGKTDPCGQFNSKLWATGVEANKDVARDQKRKLVFVSNIYVVSDPAAPENDGKVFLFKYGKKIYNKLDEAMHPQFPGERKINPFDMWDGANFELKIRKVEGYRNYEKSEFAKVTPLADNDDDIETIWNKRYALDEFVDPKTFKSYDALKERLNTVLNTVENVSSKRAEDVDLPWNEDDDEKKVTQPPKQKVKKSTPLPEMSDDEDEDHSLEYFKKLANE